MVQLAMLKKTKRILVLTTIIAILSLILLYMYINRSSQQEDFLHSSFVALKFISNDFYYRTGLTIRDLAHNSVDTPRIVGAEEVFDQRVMKKFTDRAGCISNDYGDFLVSIYYQMHIPPRNPSGRTPLEKWGSSFNSWLMNETAWEAAEDFEWSPSVEDLKLLGKDCRFQSGKFPVLWDKNPELSGGIITIFPADKTGGLNFLSEPVFNKYIHAAKEWLEPEKISIEELEEKIRNGCGNEKAFAIRMLGRKGDKKGLEIIQPFLSVNDRQLKEAAEYALKEIEGE